MLWFFSVQFHLYWEVQPLKTSEHITRGSMGWSEMPVLAWKASLGWLQISQVNIAEQYHIDHQ